MGFDKLKTKKERKKILKFYSFLIVYTWRNVPIFIFVENYRCEAKYQVDVRSVNIRQ